MIDIAALSMDYWDDLMVRMAQKSLPSKALIHAVLHEEAAREGLSCPPCARRGGGRGQKAGAHRISLKFLRKTSTGTSCMERRFSM